MNELKNAWKYKYTYEVRKLPNFDRKQMLQQKYVGVCRGALNVLRFVVGMESETKVEEKVVHDKCCSVHNHSHGRGSGQHQNTLIEMTDMSSRMSSASTEI